MKIQSKYLKPSAIEFIGLIFITLIALILIDSRALLSYYNLTSSGQALHDGTAAGVTTGLRWLDSLRVTDQLVTFIIWATVGLLCLSIIRAAGGAYGELQRNRRLTSNQYVHPTTFDKTQFWRQVIIEAVALFIVLFVSVVGVCTFVAFTLPTAASYSQSFLLGFNFMEIGNFLIGLALVYVWLVVLWVCGRALINYRQLFQQS